MATPKMVSLSAFTGGSHTAGIFSDMTVDGPNIGTLVVIMDRAKNLPNRRSMGKQDPYCAARLGKEAKKTNTDKRGGQTPRWDQELRFTVHDSADYHNLKVSVFNDDKRTELIGETFVSLEQIIIPGGGQSDGWHGLMCRGKYAGEIRIELTYYDTRPKAEKAPAEKRKESARADNGSPAVGGPRESSAVKRRPLPSDPTGASSSPAGTPDPRAHPGLQSGPRSYQTPPRTTESTSTQQRRSHHPDSQPRRRPVPDASPLDGTPVSAQHTPQHQQRPPQPERDSYNVSPNPTQSFQNNGYDASYAAPKPYEVQPIDPLPQQPRDSHRTMSQDNFRSSHEHLPAHMDLPHSYSAPMIPTQATDAYHNVHTPPAESYPQPRELYQEQPYHVEPLRMSRSHDRGFEQPPHDPYNAPNDRFDPPSPYDPFAAHSRSPGSRSPAAMQPTVEDEDHDLPPPPPLHRVSTSNVVQQHQQRPPSYHNDAPAPLNISRYREEPAQIAYDSPPQPYAMNDYTPPLSSERRYTHPRPNSRPVSRDTMAPSPLRNETAMIPASLIPGIDPSRLENRGSPYDTPPAYETQLRLRQNSEPDYRTPHYESPARPHPLAHHQSMPMAEHQEYYSHPAPEEPQHHSPIQEHVPLHKPRAMSPGDTQSPADYRSREVVRSMPTRKSVSPMPKRKSVSPRPPGEERRSSGVPFGPDDFNVYNPNASKKTLNKDEVEVNEKGQVVTFSGRVIDASDHLPLDSWAPEPEPKGKQKDRPVRERAVLSGARDIEAARQRENAYRKDRLEREKIRAAANQLVIQPDTGSPSNALVVAGRHQARDYQHYNGSNGASPLNGMSSGALVLHETETTSPGAGGRNRLQKRSQRPTSEYISHSANRSSEYLPSSNHASPGIPMPNNVLRERENLGGYGSSPVYDRRGGGSAPPIPAKVPMENGAGVYGGGGVNGEDYALSLELQSIDIGPSGGRVRAGGARASGRRYDGY